MVLRYANALEDARRQHPGHHRPLRGPDRRPAQVDQADLRVPRRPVGAGDARVRRATTTAASSRASATGRTRSSPGESRRPSRRRPRRRSPPRCARCARPGATRAPRLSRRRPEGQRRRPGLQPGREHRRLHPHAARPVAGRRRVRGHLRRRRLDRRHAGAARRARGRARRTSASSTSRTPAGPAARATSASTWRAASSSTSSTTTTGSAPRRSSACTRCATADDADIVVGKVVGHGKYVPRDPLPPQPQRRRHRVAALLWLLTPHKLFRASFARRARHPLPGGPAPPRGPHLRHAGVLPRSRASRCSPTTPVTTGCCATTARTRRSAELDPRRTTRTCARCSTSSTRTSPPGAAPRPALPALVPRQDARPRRRRALQRRPERRLRALRGDARRRGRALPGVGRRPAAVQPAAGAPASAAPAPTTRWRTSPSSSARSRSARATSTCCTEGKAARLRLTAWLESEDGPLAFRRRTAPSPGSLRRPSTAAPLTGSTPRRRWRSPSCRCWSSGSRRRRSTACRPQLEQRLEPGPDGQLVPRLRVDAKIDAATGAAGAPLEPGSWAVFVMVIVGGFRMAGRVHDAPGTELLSLTVHGDGRVTTRAPRWRRRLRRRVPKPVAARGAARATGRAPRPSGASAERRIPWTAARGRPAARPPATRHTDLGLRTDLPCAPRGAPAPARRRGGRRQHGGAARHGARRGRRPRRGASRSRATVLAARLAEQLSGLGAARSTSSRAPAGARSRARDVALRGSARDAPREPGALAGDLRAVGRSPRRATARW